MDLSLNTSVTTTSSAISKNKFRHIKLAGKLQDLHRRLQYAKKVTKTSGLLKFGGCTHEAVGPPLFLNEKYKLNWKKDLEKCVKKCIFYYLLPAYKDRVKEYEEEFARVILEKLRTEDEEKIEREVLRGISSMDNKWDKREQGLEEIIPNPPIPKSIIGPHEISEIGSLKRGEIFTPLMKGFIKNGKLKPMESAYKCLAHAIYGSTKYCKVLNRNMWRYISLYEDVEKTNFKACCGILTNGTTTTIKTWKKFCAFLKNGDLKMTTFEFGIIGKLYNVFIRIFREDSIIRGLYKCTWQTKLPATRGINLQAMDNNKWMILEGDNTPQREAMSNVREGGKNVEKNEQYLSNSKDSNITENTRIHPPTHTHTNVEISEVRQDKDIRMDVSNNTMDVSNNKDNELIARLFGENTEDLEISQSSSQHNNRIEKIRQKIPMRRMVWQKCRNRYRDKKRNNNRKNDIKINKEGIKENNKKLIFDYTSAGLDNSELELLSKGETFCVANDKVDLDRLRTDTYNYGRRLRLHEEFKEPKNKDTSEMDKRFSVITQSQPSQNVVRNPHAQQTGSQNRRTEGTQSSGCELLDMKEKGRKLPSSYDPECQNRNLNRYTNCIHEESLLVANIKTSFKDNITKDLRAAITSLKKKIDNNNIIITKADKGSGLVALDYDTYLTKGTKYIEEEAKAYVKVHTAHKQIVKDLTKERNFIVKKLRESKVIEPETATYCVKQLEEKITGMKFYCKIHKDSNIKTMPLRPLQSCINAPTHHLSQVLTDILQPLLKVDYIPTFIQDSNQLLFRLAKLPPLNDNHTIVSSDVAALYPSIPHTEGMIAITEFLEENSTYSIVQIRCIIKALELVISKNFVKWNNQIYRQTSGVAMGTPVAVAYANIFMHWVDTQIKIRAPFVEEHMRYIDDNLFILPVDQIEELMNIANTILQPHIKFTYEKLDRQSDKGLAFLDTQLFINDKGNIESRLYSKKTDKHAYLLPSSYHPSHITRNIPQAVFNRLKRICSKQEWFEADASKALEWLEDRGYQYKDIKKAIEKSSSKSRWEMIQKIENKRNDKKETKKETNNFEIPYIVTFGQKTLHLRNILKNRQPLLDACFVATKVKPRLSFRRQQNISDMIVQRSLKGPIHGRMKTVPVFNLCGIKPRYRTKCPCKGQHDQTICRCCAHAKTSLEGVKVKIFKPVDCESKNIIYVIGCNICKKKYIGETQQQLKERLAQHMNNIAKLNQPLYIHFEKVHNPSNLYISILETVKSSEQAYRKIREAWWINKLQTLEPRGFNVKLDCNQIYQASPDTLIQDRRSKLKFS